MRLLYAYLLFITLFIQPWVVLAKSPYIQDQAKVISQPMATKLEKTLSEIESKKGLRIHVVVLPKLNEEAGKTVDQLYQKLLKNGNNAKKKTLLVIAVGDKFAKIRTTPDLASVYDEKVTNEITNHVTKQMENKNYDEMARLGVAGIFHYYSEKFQGADTPQSSPGRILFNILIFTVMLVVVILILRMLPR